jgi:hypothetical protein
MRRVRRLLHAVVRLARNVLFDLKYGGFAGGTVEARHKGARATGNTPYELMPHLFKGRIRPDDVLVDVGCGKGRVINWWLENDRSQRIVGLELLEEVAAATKTRLRRYANVTIVPGDAIKNLPEDGTLFFLFNPFDADTLMRFKERLRELCQSNPKRRLLYFAPVHLEVFSEDPDWDVAIHPVEAPPAGKFEERHKRLAEITWRGKPA